jgi:hypothetical protein
MAAEVTFTDQDGDEFPVLIHGLPTKGEAVAIARKRAEEFIAAEHWRPNGELEVFTVRER